MVLNWLALWAESNEGKTVIGILGVLFAIVLFDQVFKSILKRALSSVSKNKESWIFYFLRDQKLVFWLLSIPYLAIVHEGLKWIPDFSAVLLEGAQRTITAGYILIGLFILSNILRVANEIYIKSAISRTRPIKGYLQSFQIIAYLIGFILILAVLLNKSPLIFVSGLGALTAILMLIFKDTILSLVAGVQLTSNDLIRVGDWIEMPQFNADGDVTEIALHSVKIQNWDRTITVIPAHKFLENSFKNWRGMQDAGGRRIKRSIHIDLSSIHFLNDQEIQRLSKIKILKPYLTAKLNEVSEYNKNFSDEYSQASANLRKLTNIGTFRAYVGEYLKTHPKIHKNMTLLVRQLEAKSEGLPIEIYVFTNDIRWAFYENIQSDIFDHLFATLPEFGLKAFQQPSGYDLKGFSQTKAESHSPSSYLTT